MPKIDKSKLMTFEKWWEQNKAVYELLKISKQVAHTIWCAACDSVMNAALVNGIK